VLFHPAISQSRSTHAQSFDFQGYFPVLAVAALLYLFATHAFAQPAPSPPPAQPEVAPASVDEPWRTDRFYLETSVYTHHFHFDPAHDNKQNLILGEWNITEHWLLGASYFDNSFGQPTEYVYGGLRYRPIDQVQPFYVKVSAGLVHGYKGLYRDKIPFNTSGVAPVVIPAVGYCISRVCSELVFVGAASVVLTLGVTLP
jgi:hypothetical protein